MTAAKAGGGRDLVAYFAGHLAHVVNGNDTLEDSVPVVEIQPFRLYERIKRSLMTNERYSQTLVGLWSFQSRLDREEAAEFYFDTVLDRPIARRGDTPTSTEHLHGLIVEHAAGPRSVVAAVELSTWKALVGGPARRRRFHPKEKLFELSNRILKCLDAANRPYAEVLRLGLCPKDWLAGEDAVPTNTLKAANAFLKALRAAMGGAVGRRAGAAELASAWATAPVPGHDGAESFARSPLGAAILSRLAGEAHIAHFSDELLDVFLAEGADPAETIDLMRPAEAAPFLDAALKAGVVSLEERDLLARIMAGEALADILGERPGLRKRVRAEHGNDIEGFVANLSTRVADFVSQS